VATTFRKPTGLPSWPITLLAAGEKKGKTYTAIEATASPLVGHGFVVSCGEDDPDEYGLIPGARFDIALHDGTHRGMLEALKDASTQPRVDPSKPNLLILDGAGRWWELLSDKANEAAHRRAKKAAEKYNKPYSPDDEVTVHPDLWNKAKNDWYDVVDVLRAHDGPVIVTALLENQVVMDAAGKPTKDRHWKIKAQKGLASDVGAVVEAPEYREWYVTGTRSVRREPVKTGVYDRSTAFPDFSMDAFWRVLGLADAAEVGQRSHNIMSTADGPGADEDVILVDEFLGDVQAAVNLDDVEARLPALRDVYTKYGERTLAGIHTQAPDGTPVNGVQLVAGWRAQVDQQIAAARAERERAQQTAGAPAQQDEAARAPQGEGAREARAQQDQPVHAQSAPATEPDTRTEPEGQRANNEYQAKQTARAKQPRDLQRTFILSELEGQASVLGATPAQFVASIVAESGAEDVTGLDTLVLKAHALKMRPGVIEGLRAQGRTAEADAYAGIGKGTFRMWAELIGAHDVDAADRAGEPVNA
jgi:hypothetical protein